MKSKRVILGRITALYVMFFAVIAFGIVRSVSKFAGEDFNTGWNDAERLLKESVSSDSNIEITYELKASTSRMDFDTHIYSNPEEGIIINARPSSLDIESTTPKDIHIAGMHFPFGLIFVLGLLINVAIFIILFIIIGSLRKSIRNDDVFKKSNIALTRAIGILLIIASLLFSLMGWLEAKTLAPYFADSIYKINTTFPLNFSEILMGIVIFIIAEVFAISTKLSEEQKLTI